MPSRETLELIGRLEKRNKRVRSRISPFGKELQAAARKKGTRKGFLQSVLSFLRENKGAVSGKEAAIRAAKRVGGRK